MPTLYRGEETIGKVVDVQITPGRRRDLGGGVRGLKDPDSYVLYLAPGCYPPPDLAECHLKQDDGATVGLMVSGFHIGGDGQAVLYALESSQKK